MIYNTVRTSLRLPTTLLDTIGGNRSKVIVTALIMLCHDLQTDMLLPEVIKELTTRSDYNQPRQIVYVRIPVIITSYLRLNCYNITKCVIYALTNYTRQ